MKIKFTEVTQRGSELDQAMQERFEPKGAADSGRCTNANISICAKCNGPMKLKQQNNGSFVVKNIVCDRCNDCFTIPVKGTIKPHDFHCPICNYKVVKIYNAQKKSEHYLCPYCFKNPPQDQIRPGESFASGFRCFLCSKSGCALATGNRGAADDICDCCCGGKWRLKKLPKGGWVAGCTGWPQCKLSSFLPRVKSLRVTEEICQRADCPAKKLHWGVGSGGYALPGCPSQFTACIFGHDRVLLDFDLEGCN